MKRLVTTLCLTSAAVVSACVVRPQQSLSVAADAGANKVVIYSPHYDEPPPQQWGGLSCPGGAIHAIGRPGSIYPLADANLVFTVRSYPRGGGQQAGNHPLNGALVHFKEELKGGGARSLSIDSSWGAQTDSSGVAHFAVPEGVYKVSIQSIGWRSGEIVVRAEGGRTDSVHVWIDQQAVC